MCGRHPTRPAGRSLRGVLLGAMLTTTSPAWGADAPPSAEEEPPSTTKTVEVRGRKKTPAADAHDAPESGHVVLVDERTPPSTTVADALEAVPGVSVRRLGGPLDPSFVRIRGATARQVAVFVDGMPLNAFGASAVDLSELSLFAFDRLEVYRGFAPAHLGGFAIGGAVNLVTDPERAVRPSASVGFGSWTGRAAQASGGVQGALPDGARGQIRAHVAYASTAGDYDAFTHNGTLYNRADDRVEPRGNNAAERVSGHVGLRARKGRLEVALWDLASALEGGVPGAYAVQTREASFATAQNVLHGQLLARPTAWLTVDAGLGWRARWERFTDLLGEVGTGTQDGEGTFHGASGSVSAALRPTPWFELRGGARFEAASYTSHDRRQLAADPARLRFAPQLQLDARLLPWGDRLELRATVGLLVLLDRDETPGAEAPPAFVDGLPGFAVAFRPWDALTLRAAVARGVRPPTFLELFGDRGSTQGNPDLAPESSVQVDGGVRVQGGLPARIEGAVEVGGFLIDTRDFIVFVPNAQRVAVPINLGATRMAGLEARLEGRFLEHIDVDIGLTAFGDSVILEGAPGLVGHRVPNVPTWQIDAGLSLHCREWLRLGWRFSYTSGTFDSPSNFFEQAPRPMHDLSLRAPPGPLWPWIAVEVTNVADTTTAAQFRNPHQPRGDDRAVVPLQDFRGHPLPGRGLMVTVGWSPDPPARRRAAAGGPPE